MFPRNSALTLLVSGLLAYLLSSAVVAAPIEVIEGQPDVITESGARAREYRVSGNTSSNGELFIVIQELQAEVRELRGIVEEQSFLIEQLRQRRLDDYIDLDRRISELGGGSTAPASSGASAPSATSSAAARSAATTSVATTGNAAARQPGGVNPPSNPRNVEPAPKPAVASARPVQPAAAAVAETAKTAYQDAYQKIKNRQFDAAKSALRVFVSDFPDSQYVPNAEFWLGELYLQDSELEKARDAFYILVTRYSNHRKVPDAKFKLGKIYFELGDKEQARLMLQSVLSDHPDSSAAGPAREYLKNSLG